MATPLLYEGGGPNVAQDTLIFRVSSDGFSLVGGSGRGVGWNGIVDLPVAEVVHAIRALMDYRPETLVETARHIARSAAAPLSCEVGVILVRHEGAIIAEVVTLD